jgi:hypothetical protein
MSYLTLDLSDRNILPDIRDPLSVLTFKERAKNLCIKAGPRSKFCQSLLSKVSDLEEAHNCYKNWGGHCKETLQGMQNVYGYNFERGCGLGSYLQNPEMTDQVCGIEKPVKKPDDKLKKEWLSSHIVVVIVVLLICIVGGGMMLSR